VLRSLNLGEIVNFQNNFGNFKTVKKQCSYIFSKRSNYNSEKRSIQQRIPAYVINKKNGRKKEMAIGKKICAKKK